MSVGAALKHACVVHRRLDVFPFGVVFVFEECQRRCVESCVMQVVVPCRGTAVYLNDGLMLFVFFGAVVRLGHLGGAGLRIAFTSDGDARSVCAHRIVTLMLFVFVRC